MLQRTDKEHPIDSIQPVLSKEEIVRIQEEVRQVHISDNVQRYILSIIAGTRNHEDLFLGASPRASIALMQASKALAFIHNRSEEHTSELQSRGHLVCRLLL